MAKIKAVKFHTDFCEEGKIKYPAGTILPQNDESLRCVALNHAEIVSVDEKLVTDPVAEQAEAERLAAEQAEAERIAAEKAQAINSLEEVIAQTEESLAQIPSERAGNRQIIQADIDAMHIRLAELQAAVTQSPVLTSQS